jgi:hypothetical protein
MHDATRPPADWMTGFSHRPSLSEDDIARTVGDVAISCPVGEAMGVVRQAVAATTARNCGRDDRSETTSGRSHRC